MLQREVGTLIVVLVSLCRVSAAYADACQNPNFMTFAEINSLAKTTGLEKGEYETTADWQQRIARIFPTTKGIVAAKRLDESTGDYDADKGTLRIHGYSLFDSTSAGHSESSGSYEGLAVGFHDWTEGSYVGENAMGVRKSITVQHFDRLFVYWRERPVDFSHPDTDFESDIVLKVKPDQARDLRPHIVLVVAGMPIAPFVLTDYGSTRPTIDAPFESHDYERGIVLKPSCSALVDTRTNAILARIDPLTHRQLSN